MTHTARAAAKRRWLVLWVAGLGTLATVGLTATLPNRYEANARVYVDTQTVLKPLMSGLTFQPDIDQQVRMLARTLVSRPNIERLVSKPDLDLDVATPQARDATVGRLMERIKIVPTTSENLYQISYRGPSAAGAERLVQATLDMFMHAGADEKRRDSREAGQFIESQIRSYETKLADAENRLKDFKSRHFGMTGVSGQDYFTRVSALSDDVNRLRLELAAASRSRDAFRRELAHEEPQLAIAGSSADSSAAVREAESRLEAQRKQLDDLLRRYTDAHPDVVTSRRVVADLESQVRQLRQAEARENSGKPPRAPTSPVYQKLRLSVADAEAQVASLRSQLVSRQDQLSQVQAFAGRMPEADAELAQLNRDYDVMRKNYDQMVARRESALLGARLDERSQLAEFRVIEPPRASTTPVFPSRLHLALLGILASIALGLGAAVISDRLRPSFDDAASIKQAGRPVLGVVTDIETGTSKHRQRRRDDGFAAACAALLVVQIVWVAVVATPTPF